MVYMRVNYFLYSCCEIWHLFIYLFCSLIIVLILQCDLRTMMHKIFRHQYKAYYVLNVDNYILSSYSAQVEWQVSHGNVVFN